MLSSSFSPSVAPSGVAPAAECSDTRPLEVARARPQGRTRWWVHAAVTALLIFYAAMTLSAARHKGLAYDEGEHIAIGYDMWLRRDFRMETANGDLVKRWATLPLLISRPKFVPPDDSTWLEAAAYSVGFRFFFANGNDPRSLLLQCRAMIALLGVATGLLVFVCSRELFGTTGALISLVVFVTSPSMLAFGGIVCTEMATCLTLLGATWSVWRLMWRVTWRRLAASLTFVALLVLSKPTAVVLFPVALVLVVVKLLSSRPLVWRLIRPLAVQSRIIQGAVLGGLAVLHMLVAWAAIWTAYDFRYAASPDPANPRVLVPRVISDPIDPTAMSFIRWSRRAHFLPEGYTRGIQVVLGENDSQAAFMDGKWKFGGWRSFFPYAMSVKTPPAFVLLLIAGVGGVVLYCGTKQLRQRAAMRQATADLLYGVVPFLALIVVYFAIAVTWNLNIGFRHALPMYPAAYVLVGSVAILWRAYGAVIKAGLTAVLAWHVWGPISIYPHYLAYFSPLAGGPGEGYRHLVDSSLDWGMDLPGLKHWLEVHNPDNRDPLYFAYFGVGNPDSYAIKCFRLPSRPDFRSGSSFPLGPGIYAISATLFQGIGTPAVGPWNKAFETAYWDSLRAIDRYDHSFENPAAHAALLKQFPQSVWNAEYSRFEKLRFARLCAWLRHHRPPDDNVGYSILIWRLTAQDVFAAGLGPPAELEEQPLRP